MKPKKTLHFHALILTFTLLAFASANVFAEQDVVLKIFPAFEVEYDTESGFLYQLQSSTNTTTWTNSAPLIPGTGMPASTLVSTRNSPQTIFRVLVTSINDGLIAWYPLNGDANDASTNDNHGMVVEALATTNRFGTAGSAFRFDGINDHIVIPAAPQHELGSSFTLSAWFKYQVGGNFGPKILHRHPSIALTVHSASSSPTTVAFYAEPSGAYNDLTSPANNPAGVWTHIAGVYDGENMNLYVNGQLVATTPGSGPVPTSDQPFSIGLNLAVGLDAYKGEVDDVRMYNRALSAVEIGALFNLPE